MTSETIPDAPSLVARLDTDLITAQAIADHIAERFGLEDIAVSLSDTGGGRWQVAIHFRNEAERELGKLGHRIHRRTRPGKPGAAGLESLTERELQVARLVADRQTNPQIAAELFLSQKTVETHLRNIFRKVDVSSRVGLARAIERADRTAGTPGRQ